MRCFYAPCELWQSNVMHMYRFLVVYTVVYILLVHVVSIPINKKQNKKQTKLLF